MAKGKRRDNWPPRVRQVVDLVNGLLGLKPWYSNVRPGGRFVKWRLPAGRDWSGLARVVEDLLKERGAWQDGCVEVVAKKDPYRVDFWYLRVTAYQDPQPRLLKRRGGAAG
jgi:hypothetical protein